MERGGRGLNPPSSFPSPGNDSHSLPSQVLIKQEKNAPAWMYIDSYAATHRRVSPEWQVAADPAARGNGSTRAAGAESRAAESRAQGHLTRGEPKRKLRAERQGAGRPGHRTAPPGSGRERLQAAAEVPAHRLRLRGAPLLPPPPPSPPSPPLPGLASSGVADFGSSPEEAGSSLASAREWFPLRALSLLLLLHFSAPHAAAASCHRLSNQHGGAGGGSGCGGGGCPSASRGDRKSVV